MSAFENCKPETDASVAVCQPKPVRCGCGGEAKIISYLSREYCQMVYYVRCEECGTETDDLFTEAEAITAWNLAMGVKDINVLNKERNKGKWLRRKGDDCWECSECHAVLENLDVENHNFYYCYHCGADMMDVCGYMDLEKVNYERPYQQTGVM